MPKKAALITGGASGMGLAVATSLAARTHETWDLHLVDLNASAGQTAASSLPNAHFHPTNVTDYASLASAFEAAFTTSRQLDFVYANAGIVERDNFYEKHNVDGPPPPPPNQLSVDINLKAVVNTAYLALHYFRKSGSRQSSTTNGNDISTGPVLVMTASCGGLYPSEFCPMYSGSKAGVIHFARAIKYAYYLEGIRVYSTAPGTIKTNLMSGEEWKSFPERYFTPMSTLVDVVGRLVDGGEIVDSKGVRKGRGENWGLTVEVSGERFYFNEGSSFCDKEMEEMMRFTSMESQLARIERGKRDNGV